MGQRLTLTQEPACTRSGSSASAGRTREGHLRQAPVAAGPRLRDVADHAQPLAQRLGARGAEQADHAGRRLHRAIQPQALLHLRLARRHDCALWRACARAAWALERARGGSHAHWAMACMASKLALNWRRAAQLHTPCASAAPWAWQHYAAVCARTHLAPDMPQADRMGLTVCRVTSLGPGTGMI